MSQTLLAAIFEHKPAADRILIWTLETKRSAWYAGVHQIPTSPPNYNTYFGLCTLTADAAIKAGTKRRTTAATAAGLAAIWLDLDIAGPAHKKQNLPADPAQALELLANALPNLPPSRLVDSGHGLQAYWILDQWHEITDANRNDTAALLQGVSDTWRATCAAAGFDADSVCDLARLMRLPGSVNSKIPGDPKPVTEIITDNHPRYPIAAFDSYITRKPQPTPKPAQPPPDTEPIHKDRWEALCANEPRAKASWDHQRPDMPDQSPSAYDMSLAAFTVRADWTDAQITSLLVACRKLHKLPVKADSIQRTIAKARAEAAADLGGNLPPIDKVSQALNLPVTAITRTDSTPPNYTIRVHDTDVDLGTIDGLTDQRKFRNSVAAAAGILPTKIKTDQWDRVVAALLSVMQHDTAGTDATQKGATIEWLHAYLRSVPTHTNTDDALLSGEPWTTDGCVHITATALRTWIAFNLGDRLPARQLALNLRAIGAVPIQLSTGPSDAHQTRTAWRIPTSIWRPKP